MLELCGQAKGVFGLGRLVVVSTFWYMVPLSSFIFVNTGYDAKLLPTKLYF